MEQLEKVIAAFQKKSGRGGAVENISVDEKTTAKKLWSQIGTGSLFASKRLVIVRDAFELRSAEAKSVVDFFKKRSLPDGTTVVLLASEPFPAQSKQPLVGYCKKTAAIKKISVPVPERASAVRDIVARAKEWGTQIDSSVARMLLERVIDYDRILAELDKLVLYALAKKGSADISQGDVERMTKTTIEADVFAMLRSISSGDRAGALRLLHQQLAAGSHPLYILAMLRYQFRSMLLVSEAGRDGVNPSAIQKATGLSPYVIRSIQPTLARYSPRSIRMLYNKLVDADEAIKTSKIDGDIALDLLVLAMSA